MKLEIEWCEIPAGEFIMGTGRASDNPRRTLELDRFLIAKYPIVNAQYALFLDSNPEWRKGAPPDDFADADYLRDWGDESFPPGRDDQPVAWVSWHAAEAFCRWASKELGLFIALPSECQWEKAARGTDGRRYPWGDDIDPSRANYGTDLTPIGRTVDGRVSVLSHSPQGDSPYGCVDMAGNAWEWCTDWTDEYEDQKIVRGGAWNATPDFLECTFRFGYEPTASYNYIGFRCVARPPGR